MGQGEVRLPSRLSELKIRPYLLRQCRDASRASDRLQGAVLIQSPAGGLFCRTRRRHTSLSTSDTSEPKLILLPDWIGIKVR